MGGGGGGIKLEFDFRCYGRCLEVISYGGRKILHMFLLFHQKVFIFKTFNVSITDPVFVALVFGVCVCVCGVCVCVCGVVCVCVLLLLLLLSPLLSLFRPLSCFASSSDDRVREQVLFVICCVYLDTAFAGPEVMQRAHLCRLFP